MLLNIHPENPDDRRMNQVIECIKNGGLVIYPTDTVYSIGCDMGNQKAYERVARLKEVKPDKANFSIICHDLSQLSNFCKPVENNIYKLMKRALPGPYTFLLNANTNVPKIFKTKKKTIGIRIPDNNIALEIVRRLGHPIIATSVHDDDEVLEYTTDPELIHEKFKDHVDIVINGGYGNNEASTIFDCTSGEPVLVREGIGPVDSVL